MSDGSSLCDDSIKALAIQALLSRTGDPAITISHANLEELEVPRTVMNENAEALKAAVKSSLPSLEINFCLE